MKLSIRILILLTVLYLGGSRNSFAVTAEEFQAKLGFKQGQVELPTAGATLNIPPTFRFLDAESTKRVLVDAWGNPEENAVGKLGMIFPFDVSPLDEESWGVIISYEAEGYVSDEGVEKIDYSKMLEEMKAELAEVNPARQKEGYPTVTLVGWAETPHYDKSNNKLYWAKELEFGDAADSDHVLNYNIRVLGRKGVLVLNAVARMSQLSLVSEKMKQILKFVEFNPTFRYADYIPDTDKVAGYGIAGLVAGTVAAKAGFFKLLFVGLLAAKKLVIVGVVAVLAFLKSLWTGKRKSPPADPNPK